MHKLACAPTLPGDATSGAGQAATEDAGTSASTSGTSSGSGGSGQQHIAQLLGSFQHRSVKGRHACLVLEPLGTDLAAVADAYAGGIRHGLAPDAVKNITRQVLLALDHLHR